MFTGIIETVGIITNIEIEGSNKHFHIQSDIAAELKIDQSVAHNGVCLTVVELHNNIYKVTAIEETLKRTNLDAAQVGDKLNIERCMAANGRFDGHIVQGHVDETAICKNVENKNGSWLFTFQIQNKANEKLMVEKGSICVNGISLTIAYTEDDQFTVAIIPYTFEHTNLQQIKTGDTVNIEFDIVGKYVAKMAKTTLTK